MLAETTIDISAIILASATFVTALVGGIVLYRQNDRQNKSNAMAVEWKIDDAVVVLAQRFDAHAKKSIENDEVLFGMIVGVDEKVTTLANRRQKGDKVSPAMKVGV